jgi:hypothetical protein
MAKTSILTNRNQQSVFLASVYDRGYLKKVSIMTHNRLLKLDEINNLPKINIFNNRQEFWEPYLVLWLQHDGIIFSETQLKKISRSDKNNDNKVTELDKIPVPLQWYVKKAEDPEDPEDPDEPLSYGLLQNTYNALRKKDKKTRYLNIQVDLKMSPETQKILNICLKDNQEDLFQQGKIKKHTQLFLEKVLGIKPSFILQDMGYGVSNTWVNKAKLMYILNSKTTQDHDLDLTDFQKRVTKTNQHFFQSNNRNYTLFENLTKYTTSREQCRRFINENLPKNKSPKK